MSSKLSRVVLVAGLLVGGLSFSSCSQDGSPQMETADSVNYSRVAISLGDVETTAQPMEESSARALSFELDNSKQQFPKVKGLTDGTEVLCIIRSSTPQQPVNYIKAKLIKKTGTTKPTYRLTFDGTVSRSSTPAIIGKTKRNRFRQRSVCYYKDSRKNEAYAKNQRTQGFSL